MFKLLKKIDAIVVILIFTICVGVVVITMRSKTYSIGYEIASLKNKEKQFRQRQIELQSELASTQRMVRDKLLTEQDKLGRPKYILPDAKHVLREN
jgi:cell division protein FtsL